MVKSNLFSLKRGVAPYVVALFATLIAAIFSVNNAAAQPPTGDDFLRLMSLSIKDLGAYEVHFEMGVSDHEEKIAGRYIVDENRYMLHVADQTIYGDGRLRYTVSAKDREVVIEQLQSNTPMIIANPAQAFLELDKSLNSAIVGGYNDRMVSFTLTPKDKNLLFRSCFLTMSRFTNMPLFVSYETDEEHVSMRIVDIRSLRIAAGSAVPRNLDAIAIPSGYEIIDIR
ncbi:MAG: hypothetical protein SNH79_01325 [Rikenellaceae bacterium]